MAFGKLTRWVLGEVIEHEKPVLAQASEDAMVVDTMGGRMHVHWDETAQATPHGQIAFFAEFLATAGVFDRWVDACPLRYSSPNASRPRDVLSTLMLGILAGSKRCAHIAGVRGDAVAAQALGLRGLVSQDSVRRALTAMKPEATEPWMREALMRSVRDALVLPWVMDIDGKRSANPSFVSAMKLRTLRLGNQRDGRGEHGSTADGALPGTGGGVPGLWADRQGMGRGERRSDARHRELVRALAALAGAA